MVGFGVSGEGVWSVCVMEGVGGVRGASPRPGSASAPCA